MAELYVVGGASRCGKSTVLKAFVARQQQEQGTPLATISTDHVLNDLWREYDGQYDEYPDLLQQVVDNENDLDEAPWIAFQEDTDYLVKRQHAQSRAVWGMRLGAQIESHLGKPGNALLLTEGIALLPDLIAPLAQIATVNAVYLGNESPDHADALILAARDAASAEENWMHGLSDGQIRAYMGVKEAMSIRIRELAAEYNFPYLDMGQGDFQANVERAVDVLVAPA